MIKDYDNYSNGKDFSDLDEETQNIIYAVQKSMDEAAMVIIAFSQMTIESFCNAYLIKTYSKRYCLHGHLREELIQQYHLFC